MKRVEAMHSPLNSPLNLLVSLINNEESGKPISKPFAISEIKFANPLYAFGKVANFDLGNFATLPNAKMGLANFILLIANGLGINSPLSPLLRKEKDTITRFIPVSLSASIHPEQALGQSAPL